MPAETFRIKVEATNLDEMLLLAENGEWRENVKEKHKKDAANGWYRYDTEFAQPIQNTRGEIDHYNIYEGTLLIRNDADGKSYLYDLLDIQEKKKAIPSPSSTAKERSEIFEAMPSNASSVPQNTPDVKNSIRNRNETDTQSTLRAQAEETVRDVLESYPANLQEARITAVAQSLRETGETALADEVIRVWQDAGGENEKTTIAKFTAATSYSVTPALYLEVVKKVSSGYDADQNGTISQKELRKALDSMKNLTQNQKAVLYQLFEVGWKTNPYGNTKDIREAYQKAKGK